MTDASIAQKMADVKLSESMPDYIQKRLALWEKFKARYEEELAEKQSKSVEIVLKAKNKDNEIREVKGNSWKTTPIEVAKQIAPKSWCETLVISKVNGVLWDLERPIETDATLEFLTFDATEGN